MLRRMYPVGFPNLEIINASIRELYRHFTPEKIGSFREGLTDTESIRNYREEPIIKIQYVARSIANYYRFSIGSIIVSFRSDMEVPGGVELSNCSDFFVELNSRYKYQPSDVFAILAHEVTHIFLRRNCIEFSSELDNEVLTDTTAAYLGLGVLILNCYKEEIKTTPSNKTKLLTKYYGYLTPVEFGYILAKRAMMFNDNSEQLLTKGAPRDAFYAGRAQLDLEYRYPPVRNAPVLAKWRYLWNRRSAKKALDSNIPFRREHAGYIFEGKEQLSLIFECRNCWQQLRIPTFRKILARCPVCGASHDCQS